MSLKYVKHEKIWLRNHPEFNETWLQERIVEDPSILGLGDVEVRDVQRRQPSGGRLDILLQDSETDARYEVELMLGIVDESHIIRCLEYWDNERKRYPYYDHTAVLVAEKIISRFLNVIGLFNSTVPLVAIQLDALKVGENIILNFTRVLDVVAPGEDDEEGAGEATDRGYWEKKGSKDSVAVADACLDIIKEIEPSLNLNYKKGYIGLASESGANNFVIFRAKRVFARVEARLGDQKPWLEKLEKAGIVTLPGKGERPRIHFRLTVKEVKAHRDLLKQLFEACYREQQD